MMAFEDEEGEDMTEHKCNILQDGVCGLHGVEVERRRNSEDKIKRIPFMLSAINKIIGTLALSTILILGSYAYTKEVKGQHDIHQASSRADYSKMDDNIKALATTVARTEEKYIAILRELEILNKHLAAAISQNNARMAP